MAASPALMDDKEATRLRLDLRRIPRTPLRSVQPEALVKVRGFVVLQGPAVAAPVTGRPCAIYSTDSELAWRGLDWMANEPLPPETGGRDLILDDGTGRAWIRIDGANLSLLGNWRISLSTNRREYLAKRSGRAPNPRLELEYRELTVVPGEILTVYGRSVYEADPGPPTRGPQPYRTAPVRNVFIATPSSPLYLVQEHVVALDAVG
jgi:hypothetical protein